MAGGWGTSLKATGGFLPGMSPSSGDLPVTVTSETWNHAGGGGGGVQEGREREGNKVEEGMKQG